jgi:sulfite dehydrogenase (quinone) subunit SoeC
MHPALSVIVFTVASGAGYGLLALLGFGAAINAMPGSRIFGGVAMALALVLITGGLIASTRHLGHPERAWRAVSQWRSSWLSREGLLALAAYPPALLFGLLWLLGQAPFAPWRALGLVTGLLAVATVFATGMIYASLRPIRQWANGWTVANYLMLALASGAVWLAALTRLIGRPVSNVELLALALLIAAYLVKLVYWRVIDSGRPIATAGTATGLAALGRVRLLEPPHTGSNYLLDEMGFRVARKHAQRLRQFAVLFAFCVPFLLFVVALLLGRWAAALAETAAGIAMLGGLLIERWLFFAEATHTVNLYYGAEAA